MTGGQAEPAAGERFLSRAQDHVESIARILGDLQGTDTVAHELIQNAGLPRRVRLGCASG